MQCKIRVKIHLFPCEYLIGPALFRLSWWLSGKESTYNTGDSIPGSGRSPGGGNGNPLQLSYLENPMHRGAWRATVHGVSKELDTTECADQHCTQRTKSPTTLPHNRSHHRRVWLCFWTLRCPNGLIIKSCTNTTMFCLL